MQPKPESSGSSFSVSLTESSDQDATMNCDPAAVRWILKVRSGSSGSFFPDWIASQGYPKKKSGSTGSFVGAWIPEDQRESRGGSSIRAIARQDLGIGFEDRRRIA
ncbi:unnamed protein product [Caenorhabditis bovis]|uniref:Uncharacterized protein n=1 Tax=Caenorhabditis bovis TaxID=2654633 RepID=A0A8S1ENK9_9PELO|nr:unnamed protein product [Caenorhabditis bovis]